MEPQGASHSELNQTSPQFQADRPQSVKVYGHIEGQLPALVNLSQAPAQVPLLFN
jgi:hypothetical protein